MATIPLIPRQPSKLLGWVVEAGIGLIFLSAGALKAWDSQSFAYAVQNYQLTSWTGSLLIAIYLPWLEILAGLALLARRLTLGALTISLLLSLLLLGAIGSAWWRDLDISCGCFGSDSNRTNYPLHIAANLLMVAALLWRLHTTAKSADCPPL